jgi:hypothetical protein
VTAGGEPVLRRLAAVLREEGGLLAGAVADPDGREAPHGALAAAGPRSAGHEEELALVVEAIREGYLLHYGEARVVRADDRDLALLAGDRLYALGLARLAALGDLHAVAELADVIALSAQGHAEGRDDLAEAVWDAGVVAVGWGPTHELRTAKARARGRARRSRRAQGRRAPGSRRRGARAVADRRPDPAPLLDWAGSKVPRRRWPIADRSSPSTRPIAGSRAPSRARP